MNGSFLSLANLISKKDTTVKMSQFDFCEPAFLLGILSLYKSGIVEVDCNNIDIENYLNRTDFLKHIGVDTRSINRQHSNNLVEITPINKNTSGVDTNKITKKIVSNIGITYEVENKFIYGTLEWIFWELIDNSIQHSNADFEKGGSYFMVQSYPKRGELHICIVDNGIGIKESLIKS
ncbi:ATP-binding protein [Candidatus Gracilibacteria bacterium 28_42_T64]|nr:ATP-binding protein [Candidatus Gracilibacteria bacterium 28_42_T64]